MPLICYRCNSFVCVKLSLPRHHKETLFQNHTTQLSKIHFSLDVAFTWLINAKGHVGHAGTLPPSITSHSLLLHDEVNLQT